MIKRLLLLILFTAPFLSIKAQNLAIGAWKDCLPYRYGTGVVQGNGKVYCITPLDIFSVTTSDNSIQQYSKASGLSDIGISTAAYDSALHVLVIGYNNSNIDLLYDNGRVINVPAVKQASIIGNTKINGIYFIGSDAYLACGFGIVNLNLSTQLINDTYIIGPNGTQIAINSITSLNDTIYAATANGVSYNTLSDSNGFADYASWNTLNNGITGNDSTLLITFNHKVYLEQAKTLYVLRSNKWTMIYNNNNEPIHINGITASNTNLVMAEDSSNVLSSEITLMNTSGVFSVVRSSSIGLPLQALQDKSGNIWIADFYNGLYIIPGSNVKLIQNLTPNGPYTASDNSIAAYNGNVYVAPVPQAALGNTDGFFFRTNNTWYNFNQGNIVPSTFTCITNVVISPIDYTAYFGMFSKGIFQFAFYNNRGNIVNVFSQSTLSGQKGFLTSVNVSGMAFDNENNLWVSNYGAAQPIAEYNTSANTWQSFGIPSNLDGAENFISQIAVDQYDQKWILDELGNILVMSAGNTNITYRILGTGVGNGNLPTASVTSIVVDQLGNIWVGTTQGITVFYCPGDELTSAGCDAQQPIYSSSAGNGYLLGTDDINAIVVDGANRKWVGTNTGLYLLSSDGSKEIENFNTTNSPLFSNNVISLALDPVNGDLYVGTDQGILEYRTNSNAGNQTSCTVNVFPDPVRQNYTGPITIGGLVANATVKITDVNGSLIYETTALGGEATWNGNAQNGQRAKTGVYLVFVSNSDGSVTCTGKFLLIN